MLSKSNILSYLQCARKLWLEQHEPELASPEDASTRRRKNDGNLVGGRARDQLGEGFLWPPVRDDQTVAAEEAKSLLRRYPQSPAAEVPMVHEGLYARADALIPERDGYVLQETKASTFPLKSDKLTPGKPNEHHLNDVAIQAWVMSQTGIPMKRAELNLLNNRWRYPGGGDYSGLFRQLDATAEIRDRVGQVPGWLDGVQSAIKGDKPEVRMAKHCHNPYECPFQDHCRTLEPPEPDHPIELLPDAAGKLLFKSNWEGSTACFCNEAFKQLCHEYEIEGLQFVEDLGKGHSLPLDHFLGIVPPTVGFDDLLGLAAVADAHEIVQDEFADLVPRPLGRGLAPRRGGLGLVVEYFVDYPHYRHGTAIERGLAEKTAAAVRPVERVHHLKGIGEAVGGLRLFPPFLER